jgi:YNFM family putative membrane transporter
MDSGASECGASPHGANDPIVPETSHPSGASLSVERVALYAGTVAAYADMYLTQPILPVIAEDFGLSPTRAALTVSVVVLFIAGASLFYGPLSDAIGRRRVMAGAAALLAVATFACALAPSFEILLALRGAQGALVPGITAVSVAYVGDRFDRRSLPAVVGGLIAVTLAGGILGRVASGAITAWLGWRAAFAAFGLFTAVAAFLLGRALVHVPPRERYGLRTAWVRMARHLRNPRLVGAYLVGGSLFFAWMGIFTYLPFHLSAEPYQLSMEAISSVYLVLVVGVIVSPIAGRLWRRIPARQLIGLGLVIEAAGIALTLAKPLPLVVAGLLVLVGGAFTAQAVAPAFVNVTATDAKGGASALYLTAFYIGGTLGAALPGLAWHRAGWAGIVGACAVSCAVGLLANAILCGRAAGTEQHG